MSNLGDLTDDFDERVEAIQRGIERLHEATDAMELQLERARLLRELPGGASHDAVIQAGSAAHAPERLRPPERHADVLRRAVLELRELRRQVQVGARDDHDAVDVARVRALPAAQQEKLRKLLGVFDVRRQEHLGASFAESSFAQLATCFDAPLPPDYPGRRETYENVQRALQAVRGRLGSGPDEPVSDAELRTLLTSASPDDRAAGMALLEHMSAACADPTAIDYAMRHGDVAALRQNLRGEDALHVVEVQTSFIKAARSKLATMMFQTVVHDAITERAAAIFSPRERVHEFVALVGFNRVMSANNVLGASLASDVDFNMVIDDHRMREAGFSAADVESLRTALAAVAQDAVQTFRRLDITLDVADYTVKTLSGVENLPDAAPLLRGIETRFLSTILYNQVLLSGSPEVQKAYLGAIDGLTPGDELAALAFDQYLGDSTKGSLKTYMHLGSVHGDAADAAGSPMFRGYPDEARRVLLQRLSMSVGDHNYVGRRDFVPAGPWRFSTKFLACRLNDYFDAVPLSRYRDGRGDPSPEAARVFEERYVTMRPIAAAVNRFGVQMQDRIYELLAGEGADAATIDARYTEVRSDDLARVLVSDAGRQKLLATLDAMTAELTRALAQPPEDGSAEAREFRAAATAELKRIQRAGRALRQQRGVDTDTAAGRSLFVSLGALVEHSAVFLDPRRRPQEAASSLHGPRGQRAVKKSNRVCLVFPPPVAPNRTRARKKRVKKQTPKTRPVR